VRNYWVTPVISPWGADIAPVWPMELEFNQRRGFACFRELVGAAVFHSSGMV